MKTNNIILLSISFIFLFASCKPKKGENETLDPNNNTTIEGYMSTKPGSWWLYSTNEGKVLKRTATGGKATKDEFEYDLYKMVDTTSVMQEEYDDYFAKNEKSYLTLIDLDGSQANYVRAIIYKEDEPIGSKWENTHSMTYSGLNFNLKIESEITGIYETKVINGVTYDSVFVTINNLKARQIPAIPTWTDCGKVEMWFKRGVGILKRDFDIEIRTGGITFFSRDYSDEIISYHIAP